MAMTYVAMCLADALGAWRGLSEELEAPVEESSGSLTLARLSSHLVRSGFCFIHFGKNCGIQMPQHARSVREGHREGRRFVRSSVVISGHQWSSEVISGHQWSSAAISGHQRPSVVISGHQWSSAAISGHQWSSVAIKGHQRSSEVIRGHQSCPLAHTSKGSPLYPFHSGAPGTAPWGLAPACSRMDWSSPFFHSTHASAAPPMNLPPTKTCGKMADAIRCNQMPSDAI
jgi:hypothetical protein